MMERIPRPPWLNIRPYIAQRLDLRQPAPEPAPPAAAVALFNAPFRDSLHVPCAACGQGGQRSATRRTVGTPPIDAFLMLCDDVRACNAATAAVA